jgi:hypothetical protein
LALPAETDLPKSGKVPFTTFQFSMVDYRKKSKTRTTGGRSDARMRSPIAFPVNIS